MFKIILENVMHARDNGFGIKKIMGKNRVDALI
jgi:hypothetical protein